MRELKPSRMSTFFPERWEQSEKPWRVWRTWRDVRTIAGDYSTKDEAQRAIKQLGKFPGALEVEFIGKSITHCSDGGKPI